MVRTAKFFAASLLALLGLGGCNQDYPPATDPKPADITGGLTMGARPAVLLGTPAPDFAATRLSDGKQVKISDLKGKVVLIDFWATWCPPCVKGLPHIEAFYKEFKDKGLEVIAVSDEKTDTIKKFIEKNGYTMPIYQDTAKAGQSAYKVGGIPVTVLLDKEGNMVGFFGGFLETNDREIREKLLALNIS